MSEEELYTAQEREEMIQRVNESFKQDAARYIDSYVTYNTQNVRMRAMAAGNGHSKRYFPTVPSL